jgi:hypothetical protein
MVRLGLFEVQLGFKSYTEYFCKKKRKENVNKIHQISLDIPTKEKGKNVNNIYQISFKNNLINT